MRLLIFLFCLLFLSDAQGQNVKVQFPIGHPEGIRFIEHSANGLLIFSVSFNDNYIRVWETSSGRLVSKIPTTGVKSLILSPENEKILVIGTAAAFLWDVYKEQTLMQIIDTVLFAAFQKQGNKLIYCNQKSVFQVDLSSQVYQFEKTFTNPIHHIEFLEHSENIICVLEEINHYSFHAVNLEEQKDSLFFQSAGKSEYSLDAYFEHTLLFTENKKENVIYKIHNESFKIKRFWTYKPMGRKGLKTMYFDAISGCYALLYKNNTIERFDVKTGIVLSRKKKDAMDQVLILNHGKTFLEKDQLGLIVRDNDSVYIHQYIDADFDKNLKNVLAGVDIDRERNLIHCAFADNLIRTYSFDNDTLKLERTYSGKTLNIDKLFVSETELRFVDGNGYLKNFDRNTGALKNLLQLNPTGPVYYELNENINRAISVTEGGLLTIWDIQLSLALDSIKLSPGTFDISMQGQHAAVIGYQMSDRMTKKRRGASTLTLIDIYNSKILQTKKYKGRINSFALINNGRKLLVTFPTRKMVEILDLSFKSVCSIPIDCGWIMDAQEMVQSNALVVVSNLKTYFFDARNMQLLSSFENPISADVYWDISPTGNLFCSNTATGRLALWDIKTYKKIGEYDLHEGVVIPIFLSDSLLLTYSHDGTIKYWRIGGNEFTLKYTMLPFEKEEYAYVNENGYYFCTREAVKKLHYMASNLRVISFEQLDVQYNRPDLLLRSMASNDSVLVASYQNAYHKRMKRLSIDTNFFTENTIIPELVLTNQKETQSDNSEFRQLCFRATSFGDALHSFNVWVNEIPLFGMNGSAFESPGIYDIDTCILVQLTAGISSIELAVKDEYAKESLRAPFIVNYTPTEPYQPKTYFIGIGIDQFNEPGHALSYSVKDVRDLAQMFRTKLGDAVIIDTLFNQNVTAVNVVALKQRLLQSNINDKVIISYSGHGLLSKDFDYYLSSYTVDFKNPESGGIPYELLEDLLDSIPARQKLLLIDACHSGEVDKEELMAYETTEKTAGIKGAIQAFDYEPTLGLKNSFQLMQELFVNLQKGSGATVISAAAGNQYALEGGKLENGFFTYAILDYMKSNESVSINALKTYVFTEVERLSGGLQKPTSRRENMEFDWRIW